MQSYQCHKRVNATRIVGVQSGEHPDGQFEIETEDGPLVLSASMVARYRPVVGDYLVEYEDGYRSISPAKAFDEGYHLDNGLPLLARFDDGLSVYLDSHSGGAAPEGAWGKLRLRFERCETGWTRDYTADPVGPTED